MTNRDRQKMVEIGLKEDLTDEDRLFIDLIDAQAREELPFEERLKWDAFNAEVHEFFQERGERRSSN